MLGYREPHRSQGWLVESFFKLHQKRGYISLGMAGAVPAAISYAEMTAYADGVLGLHGRARDLFFRAVEETDSAVLADASESMQRKAKAEEKKKVD